MYFSTLSEWLDWISSVHSSEWELGLDRVKQVAIRLDVLTPNCPVIIVGGTNGKGSTVAGLEAIYRAAGYRVGAFTSPILFKHNEQVRIDGREARDEEFCQAFEKIEAVRGEITLTPFEFCTLAALLIFKQYPLDVWILEVGLGGRLDAVNILDADVAVVTSISIDHVDWLGSTREAIGREKAGIFRAGKPAVCGDSDPPSSLVGGAPFFCQGKEFHYQEKGEQWSWISSEVRYDDLPLSSLMLQNMSTVLMTVTLLQSRLPVNRTAIEEGLSTVTLVGRVQIVPGSVMEIYDVSHNPASMAWLAKRLREMPCEGKTRAVFSMLADKDMAESIQMISGVIDQWYMAPLSVKRAAGRERLEKAFEEARVEKVTVCSSIEEAYQMARKEAQPGDRVVVFGSFHTVSTISLVNSRVTLK
ncbi:MAG: bifunctional tetrahydrofolate synthase/dihydrofolate synthase [Gammaproteobacteria bacterium]|nr:MAG: bifunctional tetrahydrofolate synthase/dihydrofolate synthase [Gammaproteobacteria bacterium]